MSGEIQIGAKEAVELVQAFDAQKLIRQQELGERFAFDGAVPKAEKLIKLFGQIPAQHILDLPDQQAQQIQQYAQGILNKFNEILDFDPVGIENPSVKRDQLEADLDNIYLNTFNQLYPHLAYLGSRQRDFGLVEAQAQQALASAQAAAQSLQGQLTERAKEAENLLSEMRKLAAEQGVSQEAIHFSNESSQHEVEAKTWQKWTIGSIIILLVFGIASIFLHKLPFIEPKNSYDAIQLAVSKILIFVVLGYGATLSAKNFLAHRHNAVVNKHRQNALATYRTIADAASDERARDIVLSHAASCIFSPQDTGYQSIRSAPSDAPPTLQILPRIGNATDS